MLFGVSLSGFGARELRRSQHGSACYFLFLATAPVKPKAPSHQSYNTKTAGTPLLLRALERLQHLWES